MTSLVTTAEVNALNAGGGLGDSDLQALIDREEAELVRRFGAHTGSRAETLHGGKASIYLKRPIASVESVVESLWLGDSGPQTLTSADYVIWADEGRLERIYGTGYVTYNAGYRWGPRVVVTYTPADDSALRKQVLIELVRVGAAQDTGASVSGLGYSIGGGPADPIAWERARAAVYARLAGPGDR